MTCASHPLEKLILFHSYLHAFAASADFRSSSTPAGFSTSCLLGLHCLDLLAIAKVNKNVSGFEGEACHFLMLECFLISLFNVQRWLKGIVHPFCYSKPTGFSFCGTQKNMFWKSKLTCSNVVLQIEFDYVDQNKLKHSSKYILCSTKERIASRFGAIRGWINKCFFVVVF